MSNQLILMNVSFFHKEAGYAGEGVGGGGGGSQKVDFASNSYTVWIQLKVFVNK